MKPRVGCHASQALLATCPQILDKGYVDTPGTQKLQNADEAPEDAFRCLVGAEIWVLVVGDCLLRKEQQNPALKVAFWSVLVKDVAIVEPSGGTMALSPVR